MFSFQATSCLVRSNKRKTNSRRHSYSEATLKQANLMAAVMIGDDIKTQQNKTQKWKSLQKVYLQEKLKTNVFALPQVCKKKWRPVDPLEATMSQLLAFLVNKPSGLTFSFVSCFVLCQRSSRNSEVRTSAREWHSGKPTRNIAFL